MTHTEVRHSNELFIILKESIITELKSFLKTQSLKSLWRLSRKRWYTAGDEVFNVLRAVVMMMQFLFVLVQVQQNKEALKRCK
jgi:hypothetical protein